MFFLLAISSCRKNYEINDSQILLFQYDYVNYTWGYQHMGFLIDDEGTILTYYNPEEWNFPDIDLVLSEKEANENIERCTPAGKKIEEQELQKFINYIRFIASSKVTAVKHVAADAGTTEFICYQFSEDTGTYKGYLVKMEGDFACENLNFYSKKVVAWLKDTAGTISWN